MSVNPRTRERILLAILLAGTALLYLWGLGASGWANDFYSAAAQAGSQSWKAFFFGASDAAGSITVDKTPASLWAMALSVKLFGLSSWSILVPQALMGVATVFVLYATVRRWFSFWAALLAGAVLALTPVAALMFRFNNPDAMLVLLLTLGAYALVRAMDAAGRRAGTWWLVASASLVGFGFLAKMLQALLVVPVFALVYLVCADTRLRRRLWQLLLAGAALVVSAGWWIAIVELVPARLRPYVGGSQTNSILELTLGYNGLGRLTGNEIGSVGGGRGGSGGGWGESGWDRLFGTDIGGQIAWLVPAALILFVVVLWATRRAPRTDRTRAAFLLWGGWLLVTGLVFSFMQGIFHQYYTVALAPAVAALVGMGVAVVWSLRRRSVALAVPALVVAATAVWSYVLLGRSPDFLPWLRTSVLVVGPAAAVALLFLDRLPVRAKQAVAGVAMLAVLAGPIAYTAETVTTPHAGAIVTAGPMVDGGGFGPAGGRGRPPGGPGAVGQPPQVRPGDGDGGGMPPRIRARGPGPVEGPRGMGGLLNASRVGAAMKAALEQKASAYTWVAATVGANNAAGYQLATERPVMAIGGFNGSDPSPTLEQFKAYVKSGRIHYFIGENGDGRGPGGARSSEISSWVAANFKAETVDGIRLYDLTEAK